jgi:PKD repeat protein
MDIISYKCRTILALVLFSMWLLLPVKVMAIPSGISGYSGASGSTCTACHPAGAAIPTLTLSADSNSTTVSPGSTSSYTLTMTGGPAVNAGLDVAVSAGTIIDTNASGTRILNGELTMSSPIPVSGGSISWTFDWQAPTSSGTYTIYAAALSANGNGGTSNDGTETTSLQLTVSAPTNQPPTSMISGPTIGIEGVAVTFDGSASTDADGSIASYDWDFGDGSAATGWIVSHTYFAGSFTVSLTVTDNSGNTDTATLNISVAAPNVAPTAVISGPTNGTEGIAVSFDGSGSSDLDGTVVSYDWDFGDNSAGSGMNVTHTYAAGTYTLTLAVTDDMGATDSATINITITATTSPQPPIADAGGSYSANVGVLVQFDGSASSDPDGFIASYSWDFGDGSATGSGVGPVHIYTTPGNYTVVLTVTDDQGLTAVAQTTAQIAEHEYTPITIDIKPGSDPNAVNPRSKGVIPVAILGSIDSDVTQIDSSTVTFGLDGASPAHDGHVEDVNDDGYMDMMFHFKTQESGIVCGDTEATLTGETFDGTPITGTDTVKTVGCNGTSSKEVTSSLRAGAMSWMMLVGLSVLGLWRLNRRRNANG